MSKVTYYSLILTTALLLMVAGDHMGTSAAANNTLQQAAVELDASQMIQDIDAFNTHITSLGMTEEYFPDLYTTIRGIRARLVHLDAMDHESNAYYAGLTDVRLVIKSTYVNVARFRVLHNPITWLSLLTGLFTLITWVTIRPRGQRVLSRAI